MNICVLNMFLINTSKLKKYVNYYKGNMHASGSLIVGSSQIGLIKKSQVKTHHLLSRLYNFRCHYFD